MVFLARRLVSVTRSVIGTQTMNYSSDPVKNFGAPPFRDDSLAFGGMRRAKTTDTLSHNLRELMKAYKFSKQDLAKKSGISDRMIAYVLAKEKTPTVDLADALAKPFGLTGWQLLIPDLSVELARAGKLEKLVSNYSQSSDKGREYIDMVAAREAETRSK